MSALVAYRQKIATNAVKSTQSYYTAESGVEDALLRLNNSPQMSSLNYNLTVNGATASVAIPNIIGGSRTITSQGNVNDIIRNLQVVYSISSQEISFHYGIQVGDFGLQMKGNAVVHGNILSNGPITGEPNTKIYGDAISAGGSGSITNSKIKSTEGGGNAWAATIDGGSGCVIDGNAHYITSINCGTVGGLTIHDDTPVAPQSMPISATQITRWKDDAADGGTTASYSLGGNNEGSLGPKKVEGNMTIDSGAKLTVTGTIWVTGDLNLHSNTVLQLGPGYGSQSGVIVVDGKIFIDSNVTLCGSEGYESAQRCNPSVGSYLMLLSTKSSADPNNPAIDARSNTKTAILYAANGFITLSSNAKLREATGYGIYMDSNAEVTYEVGLGDTHFSSGPGGSWEVKSWEEK